LARLNEGEAFHLASGIFTTPVPGIYHFEFSATKAPSASYLDIFLLVNDETVARPVISSTAGYYDSISLTASLRLKADDRVKLINGGTGALFDDDQHRNHFTGWLVEEDLI